MQYCIVPLTFHHEQTIILHVKVAEAHHLKSQHCRNFSLVQSFLFIQKEKDISCVPWIAIWKLWEFESQICSTMKQHETTLTGPAGYMSRMSSTVLLHQIIWHCELHNITISWTVNWSSSCCKACFKCVRRGLHTTFLNINLSLKVSLLHVHGKQALHLFCNFTANRLNLQLRSMYVRIKMFIYILASTCIYMLRNRAQTYVAPVFCKPLRPPGWIVDSIPCHKI